ncbi:Transmembrane and immunoglobulin domain-containing protein 1 [Varanus komodoensis]|nr:Transmembrane and immunoglobulin domain-containing protein 1 [Varanus komodoensis]
MNGFLPQGQLQMAPAGFARLLPGVPLLVFAFLPCTITGTELAINNNTTDRWLPTEPGQDQSLSCRVQNPSQAEELLWFREDGRVSLQEGNRVNASDICISPVSVDDNGVSFTCQLARNQSARISVVLDVVFPPILAGENLTSVQEEDDATLNCRTKANPVAEMTWYKDKLFLSLTEPRYRILQSSELFQLVIQKVQKSDSGNYTCMAQGHGACAPGDVPEGLPDSLDTGRSLTQSPLCGGAPDRQLPFPTEAVIAAAVVAALTILFAIVARRERILKVKAASP